MEENRYKGKGEEEMKQCTPMSLFDELSGTVIGQDEYLMSLCTTVWLHDARIQMVKRHSFPKNIPQKQNLLIVGPTGSGKTLAIQSIAKLLGYEVLIANAPDFTGTGWKGRDVEELIQDLYRECQEDQKRTEQSIIFLDEIDKVVETESSRSDAPSFNVQNPLLKLIEGMYVSVKNDRGHVVDMIDTSQILFIAAGAFEGIEKIIQKRIHGAKTLGFGGNVWKHEEERDLLLQVKKKDLLKYGVEVQFLGRFSRLAALRELNETDIKHILLRSKASIVQTMDHLLYDSLGVHVEIDESGAEAIARQVVKEKTGARGAAFLIQEVMDELLFFLPEEENVKALSIFEKDGEPAIRYIEGKPNKKALTDSSEKSVPIRVKSQKHVGQYVDYVLSAGGIVLSFCNLREIRALHTLVSALVLYILETYAEEIWNISSIRKLLKTEKNGTWKLQERTVCEVVLTERCRNTEYAKLYYQYKELRTSKQIIDYAIAACEEFERNPYYEME